MVAASDDSDVYIKEGTVTLEIDAPPQNGYVIGALCIAGELEGKDWIESIRVLVCWNTSVVTGRLASIFFPIRSYHFRTCAIGCDNPRDDSLSLQSISYIRLKSSTYFIYLYTFMY